MIYTQDRSYTSDQSDYYQPSGGGSYTETVNAQPPLWPSLPPSNYSNPINFNPGSAAGGPIVLTSSSVGGSGKMGPPPPDPNNPPVYWCMYHQTADGEVDGFDCVGPSLKNPINKMPAGWRNCMVNATTPDFYSTKQACANNCGQNCKDGNGNPVSITTSGVKGPPGFIPPAGPPKRPPSLIPASGSKSAPQ